jgi:hypothetical protein
VKALLIVPHILQQRMQIDHRVSVVLPDDGEKLTFGGAKGVRRRRFEVLGDLGTDVRRIGRFACGLLVDALEPGPLGAGGVPLVAVGGDVADVPLGIYRGPQSTVGVRRWRRGRIRACAFA